MARRGGLFDPDRGGRSRRSASGGVPHPPGPGASKGRRRILTVSELTERVRDAVEERVGAVWVQGEVSNLSSPGSGHIYLTLKDGSAEVRAVIWRSTASHLRFTPEDGEQLLVFGRMTVYEARGQYQLVVERAEPIGVGALQRALEELKRRLAGEGLFDEEHKRPLPWLPRAVGIVTSPTGAAVRDMINVTGRRWPSMSIVVAPTPVQGEGSAARIAKAIEQLDASGTVDVMIVGRGGGSLEDLWAFNEEVVARAIFASKALVVSAVGHETDFTIADLVADLRAPTPSAAAELVVPRMDEVTARMNELGHRLPVALTEAAHVWRERLTALAGRPVMTRPAEAVARRAQRVDELGLRASSAVRSASLLLSEKLKGAAARLEGLSPLAVLGRGYSITTGEDDSVPLGSASDVSIGEGIVTRLANGTIRSEVTGTGE